MRYLSDEIRRDLIANGLARMPAAVGAEAPCFIEHPEGAPSPQDHGVTTTLHVERQGEFAMPSYEEFRETATVDIDIRSLSRKEIFNLGRRIKRSLNGRRAEMLGELYISQVQCRGPELVYTDEENGHFYRMALEIDARDVHFGN